jgi:uncharacterized repeat protein (TIGR02059 family)
MPRIGQIETQRPQQPQQTGSATRSAAFSTSLQFSGDTYMAEKIISGPVAFTVDSAGALAGGSVTMRLIADGANSPTFSTMKEFGASQGWLNTAGILNNVTAFYDGVDYYYSVNRAVGISPVAVPTISTSQAPFNAPSTIVLSYGVALDTAQVPPASAFTVTNSGGTQTVTGVSVSGSNVTLTTSRTALSSDTITVSYTPPAADAQKIKAQGGIYAAALSGRSVLSPANEAVVRLGSLTNLTEGGNGTTGWSYTSTVSTFSANGLATTSIAPATAAVVRAFPTSSSSDVMLAFQPNNTAANYGAYSAAIWVKGVGAAYQQVTNGTPAAASITELRQSNDIVQMVAGADGSVLAQVSHDAGATWITVHTFANNTARKYINLGVAGVGGGVTKLTSIGAA